MFLANLVLRPVNGNKLVIERGTRGASSRDLVKSGKAPTPNWLTNEAAP